MTIYNRILNFLKNKFWGNILIRKLYYFIKYRRKIYINLYCRDDNMNKRFWGLGIDMLYSLFRYGASYDEYFSFGFSNLSHRGRKTFITDCDRFKYYSILNSNENRMIFFNKMLTYSTFMKFYKRNIFQLNSSSNYDDFKKFISTHERFIVKPSNESCGHGIRIISSQELESQEIFSELIQNGGCVIEELILQAEAMAKLHPYSVNTLRISTILLDESTGEECDDVLIFHPILRMGRDKRIVDNGGSGGILANIDVKTGIVYSVGVDRFNNEHIFHPDTHEQIVGFQIPQWQEALILAKELAHVVPKNRYTGWDLALTDDGWIMVEGNECAQFSGSQFADHKGNKKHLDSVIKRIYSSQKKKSVTI